MYAHRSSQLQPGKTYGEPASRMMEHKDIQQVSVQEDNCSSRHAQTGIARVCSDCIVKVQSKQLAAGLCIQHKGMCMSYRDSTPRLTGNVECGSTRQFIGGLDMHNKDVQRHAYQAIRLSRALEYGSQNEPPNSEAFEQERHHANAAQIHLQIRRLNAAIVRAVANRHGPLIGRRVPHMKQAWSVTIGGMRIILQKQS
ncbi:hypothetical protein LEL_11017 [Akanthomyces lecanii RCEF 1005]|uniref:Uncharacterized protein n=1 Tax=Akanthomyces lecanii RCEF 1005 TaxID=1081108 RepID=A0A162I8L2_CORDF|nr:hypothetical protein LEL_11017 [Akanthomyces lecanii RCEF 1005]